MRLIIASSLVAAAMMSKAIAFEFTTLDFKDQLLEVVERIYPGKDLVLEPHNCNSFYCGYLLGDDISLRSYSLTKSNVTEISAVLMTIQSSGQSEVAFSAYAGSCMALLNIALPDLTEEQTIEIARQWVEPNEIETFVDVEGYELISEVRPDQRICSIYID